MILEYLLEIQVYLLGNEVSDEILSNAFRNYKSFLKARVIKNRRTGKSKGFGFVSLGTMEDYAKAMKEMNGRYVGNRPIKLTKSSWKDRSYTDGKSQLEVTKVKKKKFI